MNARANSSDGSFSEPFDASEVVEPPGDLVEHGSSCLADNSAMVDESGIAGDFDRENLQKRYSVQRENAKYPADCYSFLSIHGPFEQPKFFAFGVIIWLFQVSFFILMVLKVAGGKKLSENEDMDNPDNGFLSYFIPSNVSSLSRMTQFMALASYSFFADDSLKDVVKAVETFPKLSKVQPGDKVNCMIFSCFLRFSQGILATMVVFLLVINTQDVVEIILNFTAVNFISGFDEIAFELAQWGKYGPTFKAEAHRIEDLMVPDCIYRKYDHVRYLCTILPVATLLIILLSAIAIGQDSDNVWLTQILRVQFQDGSVFEDYSGCYGLDFKTMSRSRKRENYVSLYDNGESTRFGYCQDTRKWILHKSNTTNACNLPNGSMIAYSTKTYYFDVSMSFEELWYSSSGRPLQLYFFDEEARLDEETCGSFIGDGVCNDYFNRLEFEYDSGDCCAASCTDTFCGVDTLKTVFNTEIVSGNGFPYCIDPTMKPITILLNDVYKFRPPLFSTEVVAEAALQEPLLTLDCDGENILMVSINEQMANQTETVWVSDGSTCMMMVTNATIGNAEIFYVDYTIFHGDAQSIETDPIVMVHGNSFDETVTYFQRVEDCFLSKLGPFINKTEVYTGSDSSNQAIRWLMKGDNKYSSCERSDFIERYALAVVNYAAPVYARGGGSKGAISDEEGLWITQGRHCLWPTVGCSGSVISELNYNALGNRFSGGTIASEIGLLKNLTALRMDSLSLTSTIPTEIGKLTALNYLMIHNNTLTGSFPTEIGELKALQSLVISDNGFTGTIPTELGELIELQVFSAYVNLFAGPIPSEIGEMKSLSNIVLDGNYLSGSLPSTIGNLTSLNYFGLSYNQISGTIPSELATIESLEHLMFDANQFVGSVPPEILDMERLFQLGVYGNNLSNLTVVDGSVICSALGSEHYCDCRNQCIKGDPVEPDRCACAEGQACCEELFTRVTPCIVCEDGFQEPNKYSPQVKATCYEFGRFVRKGIEQFGTERSCIDISMYSEDVGCICNGGRRFTQCVVCENGIENPDHIIEEVGVTCRDNAELIRQDTISYGTEETCNAIKVNATVSGCRCIDLQEEETEKETGTDRLTECIVCENGFTNPDFVITEQSSTCGVAADFIRENIAIYGEASMCDGTKEGIREYGCVCNDDVVKEEESSGGLVDECILCENGFKNPDFFIAEIKARCSDAASFIRGNIQDYGTAIACEQARFGTLGYGCECNNSNDLDDLGLEVVQYIDECTICENGFANEIFFLDKYQASCNDVAKVVSSNIEDYGTITACNATRIELIEAGCTCNKNEDEQTFGKSTNSFGV